MRTPEEAKSDKFQYDTHTVFARSPKGDVYELDAAALNAFISRAWSAYDKGWRYQIGGNIPPELESEFMLERDQQGATDCSGFCWWSTYRKRLGTMYPSNDYFKEIDEFLPGACIRYNAQPGNKFGHAIMIVNMLPGGYLETLDMTSDDKYSGIFYRGPDGKFTGDQFVSKKPANQSWLVDRVGGTHCVVSTDAIISINGVKYKPKKFNPLLFAAKQKIVTWIEVGVLAALSIGLIYSIRDRSKQSNEARRRLDPPTAQQSSFKP